MSSVNPIEHELDPIKTPTLPQAGNDNTIDAPTLAPANDNPASPAPVAKHGIFLHHTAGELSFDMAVYGGIGWIVNTGLSSYLSDKFMNGNWQGTAEKGRQLIGKALTPIVKNEESRGKLAGNLFFISTIYIGGSLLVIPIRLLENHKAALVQRFDRWWHGKKVDEDPHIIAAHQAMEHAPQQSYLSLGVSRLLALPAGMGLGMLMGDVNAPSTKLFKADWMNRGAIKPNDYSSFARASTTISRNLTGWLKPELKEQLAEARRVSPYEQLAHEARPVQLGFLAIYDLLLSLVVVCGFYGSSKLLAGAFDHLKHKEPANDVNDEPKKLSVHGVAESSFDRATPEMHSAQQGPVPSAMLLPSTRVHRVSHQQPLQQTIADLQQG